MSKSLQGIRAEYRLILTGTPLQNNLAELWSLLHWLYPEVFTDKTRGIFDTSFNLTKGQFSHDVLDSAKCLLELIMLRRMKNSPGVDLNLPPKTEIIMYVPLTPMQLFWYKRMITKADSMLLEDLFNNVRSKEEQVMREDAESEHGIGQQAWDESHAILKETVRREHEVCDQTNKSSRWQNLMNLVMRLRQVSNHPYQITGAAPDPYFTGDHVITASGKFIVLEKLVQELVVRQQKRILIFSGFTFMLDFVEELLRLRGGDGSKFRFARIDGSTCRARRNLSIRMLNDLTTDYRVMLISTRAGGLGINLASASDVVLLDQDWNPQITLQAESRAHRIGQKNPVTVYKLISQGTVEEQMMGRIQKKLYLSAKVTEAMQDIHTKFQSATRAKSDMSTDDMPELSVGQLMTLIRRGATAISRPPVDLMEMQAWDWETTVTKCRDQPADFSIKEGSDADAEAERAWLTEMERVEASIFEGAKLTKGDKRSNKDVARVEESRKEDRRIGKNVTVMIDGFAVSKDTVDCAPWEAVKTMAGRDPRLAEPVRAKKAAVESQSHCQSCFEYGNVVLCQLCPRVYHVECLDGDFQAKTQSWQFVCPQHECFDCAQKTTDAGGMLYRCRWCDKAFCEDCADLSVTRFHGDSLPEYAALDYPEQTQAYYVTCHVCEVDTHPETLAFRRTWEAQFEAEYREKSGMLNDASPSDETASISGASLTDAATIDTPGICTPSIVDEDDKDGLKRKMTCMNSVSQNGLKRVRLA